MEGERRREDQVRLGTGQGGGGDRGTNWKSGPKGNLKILYHIVLSDKVI